MRYLMAIDGGTGSVRAVIFNADGQEIASGQREWYHLEDPRYPGSMGFDWDKNFALVQECIKEALQKAAIDPKDIAAISSTSMREGIVLYDENKNEIWACANVDARSNDEVGELIKQNPDYEKIVYDSSGQTYALGALPRLLWVKNKEPKIYEKTRFMTMLNDWILFKLGGVLCSEPSNACTSGIYSLHNRDWNRQLIRDLGLKDDIFCKTYECGTVVTKVSEEAAKLCGLSTETLLVAGGGDAQLGCLGVGVVEDGQAAVFGGSFWQYEYNTSQCIVDSKCRVRVNCHAVPNMWQFEALAFMPGLAMRWYRDAFCAEEKAKAKELGVSAYDLLNKEAEKVPAGCNGLMCTFSDVMNFINWRHAAPSFINFSFNSEEHNKYTFYRAIMENAALVTRGHLDLVFESTGKKPNKIIFANGASKSDLWCQIVADVLGMEVDVPVVKESTALGCAMLAGVGADIYSNLSEAGKKFCKIEKTFKPNIENTKIYSEIYTKWRKVYEQQLKLADEGLTKHMWIAPGI